MVKRIKLRSMLLGGVFTLLFVVLVGRLYWVQVVQGAELLVQAQEKWEVDKQLTAVRGSILDRNGKVLAEDAPAFTVALTPKLIKEYGLEDEVVRGLASFLRTSDDPAAQAELENKIRKRLNSGAGQVEIRNEGWKIDSAKAAEIRDWVQKLKDRVKAKWSIGILLIEEHKRYYPGGSQASHVIGFSDKEGKPIMGLEKQLDNYLKGTDGFLRYGRDPNGVELPDTEVKYQAPIDGSNVKLTIDKNIQFYIENALKKVYDKYKPKSLMAIALDPKTMEVLGMANMPTFDPNKYWEMKDGSTVNHAVASQYEPGSTFKLVTLAGAVEEGLFNPGEKFQSGSIVVTGETLHDHNRVGWGRIDYLEGLKRSSNVAFVKLGYEKLGMAKLREYIDRFGFGAKTGIDLPGEVGGIVNMRYPAEFATATYGQGLTATAIQQAVAYAAIANGGQLMKPHIVKEIVNPETGEAVVSNKPEVIRRVVSEQTAKQVSELLEQVVSDKQMGTGKNAAIEGYRVAGKTGTANKVVPGVKGYAEGKWVISFIGYAPIEDPRIVLAIIADEPDLGNNYHLGGEVAAPAFKEIVSQTLRYMGVPSTVTEQQRQAAEQATRTVVPEVTGMTLTQAQNVASKYGIEVEAIGKGDKVIAQSVQAGTEIAADQRMYVVMQNDGEATPPDLTGQSLRDAMAVCSLAKLRCESSGEGYVVSQTLEGEGADRVLTLQLMPYNEIEAAGGFEKAAVALAAAASSRKDAAQQDDSSGKGESQQSGASGKDESRQTDASGNNESRQEGTSDSKSGKGGNSSNTNTTENNGAKNNDSKESGAKDTKGNDTKDNG